MRAGLRMAAGIGAVALATGPLALWLAVANRTGLPGAAAAPRLWHRTILGALGIRVHVKGKPAAGRPLLIAANHVSWTDIMVIGAAADVHFIAKAELAGWPVMGRLARLQRVIFVERERRHRSRAQVNAIARRLHAGDPVVLFAEGTTGDGTRLLAFKSTLFGAAQAALSEIPEQSVLVQPVAIAYTRAQGVVMGRQARARLAWIGDAPLLGHIRSLFAAGAIDAVLCFGEPIAFCETGDRKAVARAAEAQVREMMTAVLRAPP